MLAKEGDDNSSANLGFAMNGFNFKLLAASYLTDDSPARVLDYYRKPLSKYGEVLECANGKPVGSLTVTRSGLTCSSKGHGNLEVNGSSSSTNHELRAGTPLRFRIVGTDSADQGKTKSEWSIWSCRKTPIRNQRISACGDYVRIASLYLRSPMSKRGLKPIRFGSGRAARLKVGP